jgi:protocatechuate 3,4-dioxygenase beta subunit
MSSRKIGRREALANMGAASAAAAFGCGDSPTSPTSLSTPSSTRSTNAACRVTPTETVGPYPSLTDLFRSDIRENKQGTVLTLTIKVVNTRASCAAVPNANVEIWHVDAATFQIAIAVSPVDSPGGSLRVGHRTLRISSGRASRPGRAR